MATSSSESEVVKCGYLTKSPSSGGRGRFKKRWFVLSNSRQDCHHASGNGASASALSCSLRLDYFEKENSTRKGSIDLGTRCLMLEDPDHIHTPGGAKIKKRRQSSPCFNLILMKDASKLKSGKDAFASRFQLQAISTEEKQSWLEAFEQCGINVLKPEKKVSPVHTDPTFYLADGDSTNDLEQLSLARPTSAIAIPQTAHSPTDLAATVPGGRTFASYTGEDVTWSDLFLSGYRREVLASSGHSRKTDIAPDYSTENLQVCAYRSPSQDSRHLFRAGESTSLTYSRLDSQSESLATDLHELSEQLASVSYIVQFSLDQVFLSCDTLSAGHFGAAHKATLLSTSDDQPTLRTVSVRVIGSHCSVRDAVRMLRQACIMAQLSHDNVASVLGMTLAEQPKLIIMEYLSKGALQHHLLSLQTTEKRVRESLPTTLLSYCQQIATGMTFLVERGCVVSNLATKYILVSGEDVCKITGVECLSYKLCHEQTASPSMCQDKDIHRFERDVWSFGTVLYEIWSVGCSPFEESESRKRMESLSKVLLPPPPGCPRTIYELLMQCWNALSVDKPTWLVINEQLKDPDLVLQTEAHEGDDFVPRDGFLLGSPLELAVNLYKDVQLKYHPHCKLPSTDSSVFSAASFEDGNSRFFPIELLQDFEHSTNALDLTQLYTD